MGEETGASGGVSEEKLDVSVAAGFSGKRVNYWMISTLVLSAFLITGGGWWLWSLKKGGDQGDRAVKRGDEVTVTGVVRRSGLLWEEKQKLGLTDVEYQVTDFGDYQKAVEEDRVMGYFLRSDEKPGDLLGKCVRVSGDIPDEWKGRDKAEAYNRLVLSVAKVEKAEMAGCMPYSQKLLVVPEGEGEKMAFRGIVIHEARPAPDIGYDYRLLLDEPFTDEESASGSPQEVDSVEMSPATNVIWMGLEDLADRRADVEGYMGWGYAESRYLDVYSVKGVKMNEEDEVKSLVAKFYNYMKVRDVLGLMELYTPAKTKEEIAAYRTILGLDDGRGPILFNNVTSNFMVTGWKIAGRREPDNKELITKDGDRYLVNVEETRKSWCNADPCAGTYSFENKSLYVFEIAREGSQWRVDRYYFVNQRNVGGGGKYEALMF